MTEPTNAAWRALVAEHVEKFRSNPGTEGGHLLARELPTGEGQRVIPLFEFRPVATAKTRC